MRKIIHANVTHVSLVDKAANQTSFFLLKSQDDRKPTFQTRVDFIAKSGEEEKLVYGIVYQPDVEDYHGDYMDADTIEKSAHDFMEKYQNIDTQHDFKKNGVKIVESYIAPVDMEIAGQQIIKGTWVMVTKATDEMWADIKAGKYTGYSLAGTAEVVQEKSEAGLIGKIKSAFTKKEKGVLEMTPEEFAKALADALKPISDKLEELETEVKSDPEADAKKAEEDKKAEQPVVSKDDIAKAVAEAMKGIDAKIDEIKKTRVSNVAEVAKAKGEEEEIEKSAGYLDQLFPMD